MPELYLDSADTIFICIHANLDMLALSCKHIVY